MGEQTLALWWMVKDSFINHQGEPTQQQIIQLSKTIDLLKLSIRGTIYDLPKRMKELIDVGFNPLTNIKLTQDITNNL